MSDARIRDFLRELRALEVKYGLEIDHHGEYVGYLRDTTVSNNHYPVVATLYEDSCVEVEE